MANNWQNTTWPSRGDVSPLTHVAGEHRCMSNKRAGGNAPSLSPALNSQNEGSCLKRVLDPNLDPLSLPSELPRVLILAVNFIRWLYWRPIKNNARTHQMCTVLQRVSSVEGTQVPDDRGIMEVRRALNWFQSIQLPSPIHYCHSWIQMPYQNNPSQGQESSDILMLRQVSSL